MKKCLLLVVMILTFYGNSYGKDEINSNTTTFRKIKYSQNNEHKLCFFIEKTKEKSNNLKVAIYIPKRAVIKLKFRLKIGERNISNEIKIKKTLFPNELRVLNIKLYEKILIPIPRKKSDYFSNENKNKLVVEIISAFYK